jgi:hypothetical protein
MPKHQWINRDFVPLTVAGQRRILTGFLYWAVFCQFLFLKQSWLITMENGIAAMLSITGMTPRAIAVAIGTEP